MAHLDVYRNPDPDTVGVVPFLLDIQSNLLNTLPTRAVVPLAIPESIGSLPILRLNPKVGVGGTALIALTQDLAALPTHLLNHPITNLDSQRDEILAALDFLFSGF